MIRMTGLAATLVLAACGDANEEVATSEATTETAATPAAPTQSLAADGKPAAGFYRTDNDDGSIVMEELRADGTFVLTDPDGNLIVEGTYVQKSPEVLCFMPNAEGAVEDCWDDSIDEDGVWRSVNQQSGMGSVITRMDPPEAE